MKGLGYLLLLFPFWFFHQPTPKSVYESDNEAIQKAVYAHFQMTESTVQLDDLYILFLEHSGQSVIVKMEHQNETEIIQLIKVQNEWIVQADQKYILK